MGHSRNTPEPWPALPASMTGRYARDYYGASAPAVAIS
jgi:hypothetical protein